MTRLAIIGGTGLRTLSGLEIVRRVVTQTPYGEPSGPLVYGLMGGIAVAFMPRHGVAQAIPPHQVNYRANLWALKECGIQHIFAINAVGGITPRYAPGCIAVPHQLIDYTWSRAHTFFEVDLEPVTHVDFTQPYSESLRQVLIRAAAGAHIDAVLEGTYGATQGPRLETAAEINRMERDGCDVVGMTGMPEAALARELDVGYASCNVIANWAAGRAPGAITMDTIEHNLKAGMVKVLRLLERAIPLV